MEGRSGRRDPEWEPLQPCPEPALIDSWVHHHGAAPGLLHHLFAASSNLAAWAAGGYREV